MSCLPTNCTPDLQHRFVAEDNFWAVSSTWDAGLTVAYPFPPGEFPDAQTVEQQIIPPNETGTLELMDDQPRTNLLRINCGSFSSGINVDPGASRRVGRRYSENVFVCQQSLSILPIVISNSEKLLIRSEFFSLHRGQHSKYSLRDQVVRFLHKPFGTI